MNALLIHVLASILVAFGFFVFVCFLFVVFNVIRLVLSVFL